MICRLNVSYNYLKTHFSDFHTFFWNKDFAMLNLLTTINVTNHNETTLSHLNFLIYTLTYTPASKLQANTRSLMSHSLTWNFHKFDSHCSHLSHHLATFSIWLFDSTFFLESGWWFFSQFLSTSQNTSNATKKITSKTLKDENAHVQLVTFWTNILALIYRPDVMISAISFFAFF